MIMEIRREMLEKGTEIETGKKGLLVGRVGMVRKMEDSRSIRRSGRNGEDIERI